MEFLTLTFEDRANGTRGIFVVPVGNGGELRRRLNKICDPTSCISIFFFL